METPNFKYIDKISGGDPDFKKRLVRIIQEEFPQEVAEYYTYIESLKYQEASELVHKIKHKFSILGLEESYKLAVKYEKELRSQNDKLSLIFDEKLNIVTSFLENI